MRYTHTMCANRIIDTSIHQWTLDYEQMAELVPEKWRQKLAIKAKVQDPTAGTLMASLPWYHATWNEDNPDYDRSESGEYTNSKQYRSPEAIDQYLGEQEIDVGVLNGHEITFLPTLMSQDFTAVVASTYNEMVKTDWLSTTDRLRGAVALPMNNPEAAVHEIQTYADDSDMVTGLVFGGWDLPLGHDYFDPIYEAAEAAGMPLTVHSSGNPMHRQTAQGLPQQFATYDANLTQNLMTNLVSMVYQGVFDDYPDLEVVWTGGGISWILQTLWRCTRYYRNFEPQVPAVLDVEPHEYLERNLYVSTYPLEALDEDTLARLCEMVGTDRVLYGSGYPHWNSDGTDILHRLGEEERERIFHRNAQRVYGV